MLAQLSPRSCLRGVGRWHVDDTFKQEQPSPAALRVAKWRTRRASLLTLQPLAMPPPSAPLRKAAAQLAEGTAMPEAARERSAWRLVTIVSMREMSALAFRKLDLKGIAPWLCVLRSPRAVPRQPCAAAYPAALLHSAS
jgi:hypothetical protein